MGLDLLVREGIEYFSCALGTCFYMVNLLSRWCKYGGKRTTPQDGTSNSSQQEKPALSPSISGRNSSHGTSFGRKRGRFRGIIWNTRRTRTAYLERDCCKLVRIFLISWIFLLHLVVIIFCFLLNHFWAAYRSKALSLLLCYPPSF